MEPHWDVVTGGAGFLGSHLVDHLIKEGRHVVAVDNMDSGIPSNLHPTPSRLELIVGDTRNTSWWPMVSNRKIDRIFHLAANASVPRSSADPEYDLTTNVLGTLRMLEFAVQHGSLFVNVSSAATYGTPRYVPTDEAHPTEPISNYGVSKLAAEHYVDLFRREHNLTTRTIRFFNCFGPRQPRYIVFDFFTKALSGEPVFKVLGTGEQLRTQLHAQDAVRATLLVAEKGNHLPYNIGSDVSFSVLMLADEVLRVTGQEGKRVVTTGQSWPGDIYTLIPNINRIRSLGFEPRISLTEGLKDVANWWRRTGK